MLAYLHGHSVGGTNPSLLEAMTTSCLCICHDNIFNHEVNSKEQLYFRNAKDLSLRIAEVERMPDVIRKQMQQGSLKRLQSNYSWAKIGQQYIQLLHELNKRRAWYTDLKNSSDEDHSRLIRLAESTYPGREISDEKYLHWEYNLNPDGKALIHVATDGDKFVSQYLVIPRNYILRVRL